MEAHKRLAGKIWRWLPPSARRLLIRATQKRFTVSVVAVVRNEEDKILLLDHVLRPHSGWGPPGGFIDHNEQPEDAIRREIREETGLEITELEMVWIRTVQGHVEILFRARAATDGRKELKVTSAEIHSAEWFAFSEMPEEMSPVQKFVIEKTLS
jgi:ADP-ribose pyrophosphatase YjhB (NUDIX family)